MTPALAFIMATSALELIKTRPDLWESLAKECGPLLAVENKEMNAELIESAVKRLWSDFDRIEELAYAIRQIPDKMLYPGMVKVSKAAG
jgi:hypothetical protein